MEPVKFSAVFFVVCVLLASSCSAQESKSVMSRVMTLFDVFLRTLQNVDTLDCVQRSICDVGANSTAHGAFGKRIIKLFGDSPSRAAIQSWDLPARAEKVTERSLTPGTYLGVRVGAGYVALVRKDGFLNVVDMKISKSVRARSPQPRGFLDNFFGLFSIFNFGQSNETSSDSVPADRPVIYLVKPVFNVTEMVIDVVKPVFNLSSLAESGSALTKPALDLVEPALNFSKSAADLLTPTVNVHVVPVRIPKPVFNVTDHVINVEKPIFNVHAPEFNVTKKVFHVSKPVFNFTENAVHVPVPAPVIDVPVPELIFEESVYHIQKPVFNVTKKIVNVTFPTVHLVKPELNVSVNVIDVPVPVFNFTRQETSLPESPSDEHEDEILGVKVKHEANHGSVLAPEKKAVFVNDKRDADKVERVHEYPAFKKYNQAYRTGVRGGPDACARAYPNCNADMEDVTAFVRSLFSSSEN